MAKRKGKDYQIHNGYIKANGELVSPGIYNSADIDINEARLKSIVTALQVNLLTISSELGENQIVINTLDEGDSLTTKLEPTVSVSKAEKIKINYLTEEQLTALSGVAPSVVKKILANKPFKNYGEINRKAPLTKKRNWEDYPLDFSYDEQESFIKFNGYDF